MSCCGSFSIQYLGVKKWTLWAPWRVTDDVPALVRYEAAVNESETIYFPPAWFHGTEVLSEESFSVAHFIQKVPAHLELAGKSLWRQPYGFEACAGGVAGWRARAAAWDYVLRTTGSAVSQAME